MADFRLDRQLVDAFEAGRLDQEGEAVLADQVARILPFHSVLPNPLAASLARISQHLGGEQGLLSWLDRYPGIPRLTARLYRVMALLDQLSAHPVIVDALREFREKTPYPPGLVKYMPPDTSHETLSSVSFAIESLLADDRPEEARRVADAAVELLHTLAARAAEIDAQGGDRAAEIDAQGGDLAAEIDAQGGDLADLAAEIDSARRELREAWDARSGSHH
jgi:hypothetical protein